MKLPSREEIKHWLKISDTDRQDVADELKVRKTTVDQWLSKKDIPVKKHTKIAQMMGLIKDEETSLIRIPFTDEQLRNTQKAASVISADLQEFCQRVIEIQVTQELEAAAKKIDPAEEAELERKEHGGEASTRTA